MPQKLQSLLEQALAYRQPLLEALGEAPALRLFNGFWEGYPALAVDLYNRSLVIHDYAKNEADKRRPIDAITEFYTHSLPFPLASVLLKNHSAAALSLRRGQIISGKQPDDQTREYGVRYALDLRQPGASLYLDTRLLRRWAIDHLSGTRVLNTFAFSGSLGAAAIAGGAARVIHTDRSRTALALAQRTYQLNSWKIRRGDFLAGDFFPITAGLRKQGALFDCVFLDPPFFSATPKGRVDLNSEFLRLINRVRPLVADGGRLVAVNNAVFVSGRQAMEMVDALAASGYMELETLIPAPLDFTGYLESPPPSLPADPAPFNHSTKIMVLRARRKDRRTTETQ